MSELDRFKAALADRYSVERQIGQGAMATVYLVRDLRLGRDLAVKVLRPELAASLGPDRFAREIEIAARLQHPNIVPLYESGRAGNLLYYSMPYVEGETLRDRLGRERRLPVAEALGIASQVADALAYAHELGFVHRDIKPANILLHHGQGVLTDFGIARAFTAAGEVRLTTTGLVIGTPAYMSPEQAVGDREVDGRSDIYALACVLFEGLAGRLPFEGSSLRAVVSQHVTAPAPRIREFRPEVPKHVERAMTIALAKEPDDRFTTARDFAEALREPAVRRSSGQGPGRRHRLGYRIAVGLVVASIATLGIFYWPAAPTLADPRDGLDGARVSPQIDSVVAEETQDAPAGDPDSTEEAIAASNDRAALGPGFDSTPPTAPPEGTTVEATTATDSVRAAMELARERIPAREEVLRGSRSFDDAMAAEAIGRRQLAAGAPDSARTSFERAEGLYDRAAAEIEDLRAAADRARRATDQSMERVDSLDRTGAEYQEASVLRNRADSAYAASRYGAATDLYETVEERFSAIANDPRLATRRALMSTVQRFEESVEARDIEGLRAVFDPLDEDVWTGFFETAQNIDVHIEVERVDPERPNPTIDLVITTRYEDNRNRDQDRTNRFSWIFDQLGGQWVVSHIVPRNQDNRVF